MAVVVCRSVGLFVTALHRIPSPVSQSTTALPSPLLRSSGGSMGSGGRAGRGNAMQSMHCMLCLFVSSPHRLATSQPITAFSFLWPRPWRAEERGRSGHKCNRSDGGRVGCRVVLWVSFCHRRSIDSFLHLFKLFFPLIGSAVIRGTQPVCRCFFLPFCRLRVSVLGGTQGMAGVSVLTRLLFVRGMSRRASPRGTASPSTTQLGTQTVCLSVCLALTSPPTPTHSQAL